MRLIDADAEIKKIEEEIERSCKAIDRWRSGGMPGSSLYDIDAKVRQISLMKLPIIQQKITYRHIQKQSNW